MDRKTILAVVLILIVFWISNEFIWKRNVPPPVEQTINTQQETPVEKLDQTTFRDVTLLASNTDVEISDNIILQNELIKYRFSNLGGVLIASELAGYQLADKVTPVNLIPPQGHILGTKLTLSNGYQYDLSKVPFQVQKTENQVIFKTSVSNILIQKVYRLQDNYDLEMEFFLESETEISQYQLTFASGIADSENHLKMKNRDYMIMGQIDNIINKYPLSKLKEDRSIKGSVNWAAIKSKYFTLAFIPDDLVNVNKLDAFKSNDSPAMNLNVEVFRKTFSHNYRLYAGPLIYDNLKKFGNGIENTVEMGPKWLQWISKIFLAFLSFINRFIPNWGICIIIFSISLKVLLYPLTHKSFESTTKMQRVNPLIKEIQKKYKSDPQTMNAELRKVYKEHGVNPLGGCLPFVFQMPIILALYPVLRYSIDLRQASFLWLPDLSEPDPWLLPILMAVFMFIQQKLMTPSAQNLEDMDEKQRAAMQSQKMMMYMMPIMMFFIFKGLASGLVLYWTVFSIIGSVQQYFIKKKFS
jgi:YidC/Oxa1 family membrane protein insertase